MSDLNCQRDYEAEIRSIAEEARAAVKEEDADLQEWLHETIDGHQWVIYTAYNYDVLKYSKNADAGVDEGLVDATQALKDGGMGTLTAQLAYCAMEADVNEELAGWDPSDDKDEESEVTA